MTSLKDLKLAQKRALQQQEIIAEFDSFAKDTERCEKTIGDLQNELQAANARYPSPRTTREDIGYLTDLLKCANQKLVWEKQISSLRKRLPLLLERMSELVDDAKNPPPEPVRGEMLRALQRAQTALGRLQQVKLD